MRLSKEKMRQYRSLMVFAALLVLIIIYSANIYQGLGLVLNILKPFIVGGCIAFVVNLPLNFYEKIFKRLAKKSKKQGWIRPVGILSSLLSIIIVLVLGIALVAPQLTATVAELGRKIPPFVTQLYYRAIRLTEDYPQIQSYIREIDIRSINWASLAGKIAEFLKNGMTSMVSSTFSLATSIIGGLVNAVISLIFALYILSDKETLIDQFKRVLSGYTSEKTNRRVQKVLSLLNRNFTNFISGQCKEAVILGTMFVIAMSIFRFPYALLVGVVIAFSALIPVVGAFIGCAVGVFLIMVEDPMQALWFFILFQVLQQIENNLIYPRVVGGSVGLPSIWVLAAVAIGGSLFGVAGMLVFIPLVSTMYMLLRDDVNARNKGKEAEIAKESVEK